MSKIPNLKDVPWNKGPQIESHLAEWRARAAAQSGRSLDQLASNTPEQIPIRPLYTSADLEGLDLLRTMPGLQPMNNCGSPIQLPHRARTWRVSICKEFTTDYK